ncbi:MAG TPA: hypothetical protein VNA25_20305 [Phycisphaerae bacterium]|nr:hypothetical protein [Phycisphaerae bacterium]
MNTHEPRTNERTPADPGHEASRTVAGAGDYSEWSHHDLCELVASLTKELRDERESHAMKIKHEEQMFDLLTRCYHSGHREGWQDSETTSECMQAVHDFLCYHDRDPNEPRVE